MTTTCDEANGRFVSGRCRLALALVGVLLASVGLTGCLGGGGATTEEIDQLATTSEALAEDVRAAIESVVEVEEVNNSSGYVGCGQVSPPQRLRFENTLVLFRVSSVDPAELWSAVVDALEDRGWTVGERSGDELSVTGMPPGTVTLHMSTASSTLSPSVRTECLHADRDVVADYLDR